MLPVFKTSMTVPQKGHFGNKYYLRQTEKSRERKDRGDRGENQRSCHNASSLHLKIHKITGDLTIYHIINISLPTSVSIDTQK